VSPAAELIQQTGEKLQEPPTGAILAKASADPSHAPSAAVEHSGSAAARIVFWPSAPTGAASADVDVACVARLAAIDSGKSMLRPMGGAL
jgi:hypothetical protein